MTTAVAEPPRAAGLLSRARLGRTFVALALAAMVVLGAERLWVALVQPLWFDEAWTAQVAASPDLPTFWRELYNDIQAPVFYCAMRLWAVVAGTSDMALRAPGLIALIVAGVLPLTVKAEGLDRAARLTWGALIYAWWGVGALLMARVYAPLLAVSTLQALLFVRLLAKPTRGAAWRWAGVAACAILLQYYALLAVAAQGLVFLVARPRAVARVWPAALAFVPAAGWMAYHAPRLAQFSAMQAWHPRVGPVEALDLTAFAIDPGAPWVLAAVAAVMAVALLKTTPTGDDPPAGLSPLALTALAAAAALALFLLSGALQPVLTPRYLVPVVPGLLLGVVLCVRRSAEAPWLYAALVALFLGVALRPGELTERVGGGAPYGYETASQTLMHLGVTDVVFVWDHQAARIMAPASMRRVGAVFFRRAGYPARVTPLAVGPGDDANALALAAATGAHPGIIWIYNRDSPTAARGHPPAIAARDPRWRCQRTGDATVGSLACWRQDGA